MCLSKGDRERKVHLQTGEGKRKSYQSRGIKQKNDRITRTEKIVGPKIIQNTKAVLHHLSHEAMRLSKTLHLFVTHIYQWLISTYKVLRKTQHNISISNLLRYLRRRKSLPVIEWKEENIN